MVRAFFAAFFVVVASSAHAQEFSAVCRYETSIDDAGKSSPTHGEMSVSVSFMLPVGTPKNLQIKTTKAPCYEFLGDGDDMKIEGSCVRFLQSGPGPQMKMTTLLKIDRVSGAFEQTVSFNDRGGLVHVGHCVPARRMF